MRYFDKNEAMELNAEPWQIELLKLNPSYNFWGPYEDYMSTKGEGWNSAQIFETWKKFGPWALDDLNECVNFYFSINRDSEECDICGGNGYHQDAQKIVNSFYLFTNKEGISWHDKITEDEVVALLDAGRLTHLIKDGKNPTAEEVNNNQKKGGLMTHDAINRSILIETRLKRLGIPKLCNQCGGNGRVYTSFVANVALTLWWLHPRKGCSRGIQIENINQNEVPEVMNFLKEAAQRNAARFSKIK